MKLRDILVLRKRVRCTICGTDFDGFCEAPDEGFGYAAQIYECGGCHTVFSHSLEAVHYLGAVQSRIAGIKCPVCARPLVETLRKIEFTGLCPSCGHRDYDGTDEAEEAQIPSYQIYEQ
jgi:hypothetical protein